jgi:hypothetical protein
MPVPPYNSYPKPTPPPQARPKPKPAAPVAPVLNYQTSQIQGTNPFSAADYRLNTKTYNPYSGTDQSRSAFARAMMDSTKAQSQTGLENVGLDLQRKAQAARSKDVLEQRDTGLKRYTLGRERNITLKQQNAFRAQKMADLAAELERGKQDARVNTITNMANFSLGLLGASMPTAASMYNARRG